MPTVESTGRATALLAAAVTLLALGAAPASAHVHGVNPLECTPAPGNAGAFQTHETPAPTASKGAVTGVIPLTNGGKVPNGGGNGAAVCP